MDTEVEFLLFEEEMLFVVEELKVEKDCPLRT